MHESWYGYCIDEMMKGLSVQRRGREHRCSMVREVFARVDGLGVWSVDLLKISGNTVNI